MTWDTQRDDVVASSNADATDPSSVERTLAGRAPLLDVSELRTLVVRKLLPRSVLDRTESIWLLGSFTNPGKDLDTEKRSDLDVYVVVPDWDRPIALSSLAVYAPQSPVHDPSVEEDAWTGVIGPEGTRWDRSASEAWDCLPTDVQRALAYSVQVAVFATEADRARGSPRNVDLMIGSDGGLAYSRERGRVDGAALPGIQIWPAQDD